MNISQLHSNLKKLDVVDLAVEVLEELDKFISDLNRNQMAQDGQRSDGTQLDPDYSPFTVDIKSEKGRGIGSITDHVTLYDSGEMHKSIFSTVTVDELILDSNDSKIDDLTAKYGTFLGLTDESIKKLQVEFNKLFIPKLYAAIL